MFNSEDPSRAGGEALAQAGADLREALLLDSALELIARDGWHELTMARLARAANMSVADLYRGNRGKADLLCAFVRRIDLKALEDDEPGGASPDTPRDRLFDAVMLRFEAMEPYRDAIRVLARELPRDPFSAARVLPAIRTSLAWTLDSAGVDPWGLAGVVRVRVLGLICLRTLGVWLDDEGRDLAKTMADLDRRLRQSQRWLGLKDRASGSEKEGASRAEADPRRHTPDETSDDPAPEADAMARA